MRCSYLICKNGGKKRINEKTAGPELSFTKRKGSMWFDAMKVRLHLILVTHANFDVPERSPDAFCMNEISIFRILI